MLTYSKLSDYFANRDFLGAASALGTEGSRLGQASPNHPVLTLLRHVNRAKFAIELGAFKGGYHDRTKEQITSILEDAARSQQVLTDAAIALHAMLSLPPKQCLREDFALTSAQVKSLSYADSRNCRFANNHPSASLLDNIAAIGWSEGLKVIHDFFPSQSESSRFYRLVSALDAAASNNQQGAFEDILSWPQAKDLNGDFSVGTPHHLVNMIIKVFRMDDVSGSFISRAMKFFSHAPIGHALLLGYQLANVPKNVLAWFLNSPAAWRPLHDDLKRLHLENIGPSSSVTPLAPSAWPALISAALSAPPEVARPALENAFKSDAAWWLNTPAALDGKRKPLNLASAVTQDVITRAAVSIHEPEPSVFSKLKARVTVVKKLLAAGATLRVYPKPLPPPDSETELRSWARNAYAPTKAFLTRHPDWIKGYRSALFVASSPEVFEKLVKAGFDPGQPDKEGRIPAVLHLQLARDNGTRPREVQGWAKICALELGKKIIGQDAMGQTESLGRLAYLSVTLMRAWLKRTGLPPNSQQLEQCIDARHYLLVREWVSAGLFDKNDASQQSLWRALIKSISGYGFSFSQAEFSFASKLLEDMSMRPAFASSVRDAWKFFWTGQISEEADVQFNASPYQSGNSTTRALISAMKKSIAVFPFPAQNFSPFEQRLFLYVASSDPSSLLQAIPNKASLAAKTQLFWDLLKPSSEGGDALRGLANRINAACILSTSKEIDQDFGFTALSPEEISGRISAFRQLVKLVGGSFVRQDAPVITALFVALDEAAMKAIVPAATATVRARL
jgi:hypothetical protein